MRDLLQDFATTLMPGDPVLEHVRAYVEWQEEQGAAFAPSTFDDTDLRTYLLHLRTKSARLDQATLQEKVAALAHFYQWAQAEGLVEANPVDGFDLGDVLSQENIVRRPASAAAESTEREIVRLRALNRLAQALNRSADVQSALEATLGTLAEVMDVPTAWISLLDGPDQEASTGRGAATPRFEVAAACGLPPGLEEDDLAELRRGPLCRCQSLLLEGRLTRAVNIVECARLQNVVAAGGDNQGLLFHATVPIVSQGQPLGVLNVATKDWHFMTASDLELLSALGAQLAVALERARLYELSQAQRARLEHELELARVVQSDFLPSQLPDIPGIDLAADWRSATEVAGDFYDVFPLSDGRWGLVIADVSGKGAPAALCMVMVCSLLRTTAERTLVPAEVLMQVNRALVQQSSARWFVTVFYAILDPANRQLVYANAGHNRPILRRASPAGKMEILDQGGLPIGLFDEIQLVDTEVDLVPGDVLVAYTDGVTEVFDADGRMFGHERLLRLVRDHPSGPSQELLDAILAAVAAFAGPVPQSDDVTLLVMGCQPTA
jgi:serine phosphatase RsbU (regulator of sigma subunit)